MARFIARRLIGMVAVLFAISVIVFLIFNVIPNSDPAARIAGKNANPELIARVSEDLGLNDPLPRAVPDDDEADLHRRADVVRDRVNVVEQICRGTAGDPLAVHRGGGAVDVFGDPVRLSERRARGQVHRPQLTILALIGISMPVFWLGALLLYYLSYKVTLFPTGSYVPLTEDPASGLPPDPAVVHARRALHRLLQPRAALEHARRDERGLRAHGARQGLCERQVRIRHVLRNSMIPIVTLFGLDFGWWSAAAPS